MRIRISPIFDNFRDKENWHVTFLKLINSPKDANGDEDV